MSNKMAVFKTGIQIDSSEFIKEIKKALAEGAATIQSSGLEINLKDNITDQLNEIHKNMISEIQKMEAELDHRKLNLPNYEKEIKKILSGDKYTDSYVRLERGDADNAGGKALLKNVQEYLKVGGQLEGLLKKLDNDEREIFNSLMKVQGSGFDTLSSIVPDTKEIENAWKNVSELKTIIDSIGNTGKSGSENVDELYNSIDKVNQEVGILFNSIDELRNKINSLDDSSAIKVLQDQADGLHNNLEENISSAIELKKALSDGVLNKNVLAENIMLHGGNLDAINRPDYKKSETLQDVLNNLLTGLDYGMVTGGGTFGLTNSKGTDTQFLDADAKWYAIDLSKYKMYMVNSVEEAEKLNEFMQNLNLMVAKNLGITSDMLKHTSFSGALESLDMDSLYSEYKESFNQADLSLDEFSNAINKIVDNIKSLGFEIDSDDEKKLHQVKFTSQNVNQPNISEQFYKMHGYEGVNFNRLKDDFMYNSFEYGSVVFDLDKNNPYFKVFESQKEAMDYMDEVMSKINSGGNIAYQKQIDSGREYLIVLDDIIASAKEYASILDEINNRAISSPSSESIGDNSNFGYENSYDSFERLANSSIDEMGFSKDVYMVPNFDSFASEVNKSLQQFDFDVYVGVRPYLDDVGLSNVYDSLNTMRDNPLLKEDIDLTKSIKVDDSKANKLLDIAESLELISLRINDFDISKFNDFNKSFNISATSSKNLDKMYNSLDKLNSKFGEIKIPKNSFLNAISELAKNSEAIEKLSKIADASKSIEKANTTANKATSKTEKNLEKFDKLFNSFSNSKYGKANELVNGLFPPNIQKKIDKLKIELNEILELKNKFQNTPLDDKSIESIQKRISAFKNDYDNIMKFNANSSGFVFENKFSDEDLLNLQSSLIKVAQEFSGVNIQIEKFNAKNGELIYSVKTANSELNTYAASTDRYGNVAIKLVKSEKYVTLLEKGIDRLSSKIRTLALYAFSTFTIYDIIRVFRQGYAVVKEYDDAMVELQKVAQENTGVLEQFGKTSFDIARQVGVTGTTILKSAADWERLGYSIEEASELAKNSAVYANVGDMDIQTATEHMVSSVKAWGSEFRSEVEASSAIMDKYNEIGNNYAITSADIGSAMERSAAALKAGGNTLDEALGLITAGNIIQQDADTTANALKVMSLRIRGSKADLEDMGESIDDLASSTSKLREDIMGLTGVDIMLDENTYKSTAQIIKEIGAVWDRLTDVSQAATLEKLAGKTRASVVAGLLENYEVIDEVMKSSANSEGSAQRENERWMQSIEGHINQIKNDWESLWNSDINRDTINFFLDLADAALKVADNIGLIGTALTAISSVEGFKIFGPKLAELFEGSVVGGLPKVLNAISVLSNKAAVSMDEFAVATQGMSESQKKAIANALGLNLALESNKSATVSLTTEKLKEIVATEGQSKADVTKMLVDQGIISTYTEKNAVTRTYTAEQIKGILITQGYTAAGVEQKLAELGLITTNTTLIGLIKERVTAMSALLGVTKAQLGLIAAVVVAAGALIAVFAKLHKTQKEAKEDAEASAQALKEETDALSTCKEELEQVRDRIKEINSLDHITLADEEELEKLKRQNEELEKEQKILAKNAEVKSKDAAEDAKKYFSKKNFSSGQNILDETYSSLQTLKAQESNKRFFEEAAKNGDKFAQSQYNTAQEIIDLQISKVSENYDEIIEKAESLVNPITGEVLEGYEDLYNYIKEIIALYEQYSEDFSPSEALSSYFESNSVDKLKAFYSQLKEGEITDSQLKSFYSFNKVLEDTGVSADDLIHYLDDLSYKVSDVAKELNNVSYLSGLQQTTSELEKLGTIYSDIKDGGSFAWSNLLNNDDFESAFGNLDSYKSFIETISNSTSSIDACQDSFNKLAEEYIYGSGVLNNVTYATREATIAMLEQYGVANAQAVVDAILSDAEHILLENGIELSEVTYQNIDAWIKEGSITEDVGHQMAILALQERIASGALDTQAGVNGLIELANYAGISTDGLYQLAEIMAQIATLEINLQNAVDAGNATAITSINSELTKLRNKANEIGLDISSRLQNAKIDYSPKIDWQGIKDEAGSSSDDIKDSIDDWMDYMEKSLDAGVISYQDYCSQVKSYLDDLYNSGKLDAASYFGYVERMIKKQIEVYDNALKAIQDRIQSQIDAIQNQNKVLEKQKDNYDGILSVIDSVYNKEIDRIKDEIDALNDANDERKRALALQQAQYDLERANSQRNKKVLTDSTGWAYVTDNESIKTAQSALNDAELDNITAQLQKQIEELEKAKEAWDNVSDSFQRTNNELLAIGYFGANYAEVILNSTSEDIEIFEGKYNELQQTIQNNEAQIEALERIKEQWASVAETYQNSINEQCAAMLLGQDWEQQILSGRQATIQQFTDNYVALKRAEANAAWEAAREVVKANQYAQTNGASGSQRGVSGAPTVSALSIGASVGASIKKSSASSGSGIGGITKNKFSNALTYHSGIKKGLIGEGFDGDFDTIKNAALKPDEVPIIAKKGEAVLTSDQIHNVAGSIKLAEYNANMYSAMERFIDSFAGNNGFVNSINRMADMFYDNTLDNVTKNISKVSNQNVVVEQHIDVTVPNLDGIGAFNDFMRQMDGLKLSAIQYSTRRN